ncbi:MAG: TetR/AcrR family transcriptional regulator [Chloroflexota bacterium]
MAGRPREFDIDTALDRAIEVFFKKGYEKASLDDLTSAMNIKRPSLYKAFGNKETLFRTALETYHDRDLNQLRTLLSSEANPIKGVEVALLAIANNHIETKLGCLIANSGNMVHNDEGYDEIQEMLQKLIQNNEDTLYTHFESAKEHGYLSQDEDERALAQYFNGVLQGMAVIGRINNSSEALLNIAHQAIRIISD